MDDLSALQRSLFDPSNPARFVDEGVQVNQRHLIDKILVRYSAEFTIYREVIQNANDAGATSVEIIFTYEARLKDATESSSKKKQTHKIIAITFRNDGRPFSKEDWTRLTKIAEGNPDEDKVL